MTEKQIRYSFSPSLGYIAFYDSAISFMPESEFNSSDLRNKIIKRSGCFSLYPEDALDVVIDISLAMQPLPLNDDAVQWIHIVEGVIAVKSGKLCVTSTVRPQADFFMDNGNYDFRVCFSAVNSETDSCNVSLYFWKTDNQETNEIKVLKQR